MERYLDEKGEKFNFRNKKRGFVQVSISDDKDFRIINHTIEDNKVNYKGKDCLIVTNSENLVSYIWRECTDINGDTTRRLHRFNPKNRDILLGFKDLYENTNCAPGSIVVILKRIDKLCGRRKYKDFNGKKMIKILNKAGIDPEMEIKIKDNGKEMWMSTLEFFLILKNIFICEDERFKAERQFGRWLLLHGIIEFLLGGLTDLEKIESYTEGVTNFFGKVY